MICKALKELRYAAGYKSLRKLSSASSVPMSTLSRLESDSTNQPAPETLRKLAPFLNVSVESLLQLAGYIAAEDSKQQPRPPRHIPILHSFFPNRPLEQQIDIAGVLPMLPDIDKALESRLFAVRITNNEYAPLLSKSSLAIAIFGNQFESGKLLILVDKTGAWKIKRAYRNNNGTLTLTGTRPEIPPEIVESNDIFIAGTLLKKIENIN